MTIAVHRIKWKPCWRIIPSRYPPVELFERLADPADWDALIEVEALTNDRIRDEVGELALVPADERVSGPGATVIMAAFTHLNPEGSRFSNGTYGVFYASKTLDTSIAETRHHRAAFMRATAQPKMELEMRVYLVDLDAPIHDIRGRRSELPRVYHPLVYDAARQLAQKLRSQGSNGVAYDSVRHEGGECVGVFRPKILRKLRQERHLIYTWDGLAISSVYEKRWYQ